MKREEREALLREKLRQMKIHEEALHRQGILLVAGVDEVGRGPLAGPVCAAAVVLPPDFDVPGIDDSKKLSESKREAFYEIIQEQALAVGIGLVENRRIDEVNILKATMEAMVAAIREANTRLEGAIGHMLVDGLQLPDVDIPGTAIVKGDQKSLSIAAASIIAKVTRDRIMTIFDEVYPGYSFAANKGYGTKAHYEGIKKSGITPIHRRSFLHLG